MNTARRLSCDSATRGTARAVLAAPQFRLAVRVRHRLRKLRSAHLRARLPFAHSPTVGQRASDRTPLQRGGCLAVAVLTTHRSLTVTVLPGSRTLAVEVLCAGDPAPDAVHSLRCQPCPGACAPSAAHHINTAVPRVKGGLSRLG